MQALSQRQGLILDKKGAMCWTDDKIFRAVCTVSKRYARSPLHTGTDTPLSGDNFSRRVRNRFWYSAVLTAILPTQSPPQSLRAYLIILIGRRKNIGTWY